MSVAHVSLYHCSFFPAGNIQMYSPDGLTLTSSPTTAAGLPTCGPWSLHASQFPPSASHSHPASSNSHPQPTGFTPIPSQQFPTGGGGAASMSPISPATRSPRELSTPPESPMKRHRGRPLEQGIKLGAKLLNVVFCWTIYLFYVMATIF